jgi:hypothetical protein
MGAISNMSWIIDTLAAATSKPNLTGSSIGVSNVSADKVLAGTLAVVYWVAGIAAVIVIIVAGIIYATSDGNSSRIERAKNAIVYSIIGLIVILGAFVITSTVIGRF